MTFPFRKWWPWVLASLVALPFASQVQRGRPGGERVLGSESARVGEILRREFAYPAEATVVAVISGLTLPADSDSGRAEVGRILDGVAAHPAVRSVRSPASLLDTLLVGAGGTTAIAMVTLDPRAPGALDALRAVSASTLPRFTARNPGLTVRWTGEPALLMDVQRYAASEVRRVERRTLPITAIVTVIAFGSLLGAVRALATALVATTITLGLAGLAAMVVPVPSLARALVPLLGVALAIDYSLYLARVGGGGEARGDPSRTRRTVWLAAIIVAIGLFGVTLAPTGEIRMAGLLSAIVALLAAGAAVGLSPQREATHQAGRRWDALWHRWGMTVVRRPVAVLVLAGIPVVVLGLRALDARISSPLDGWLPSGVESVDALEDLRQAGRRPLAATLRVLVTLEGTDSVLTDRGWRTLRAVADRIEALPGVAGVRSVSTLGTGERRVTAAVVPSSVLGAMVSRDQRHATLDVLLDERGATDSRALVDSIRRMSRTGAVSDVARLMVAGLPAHAVDYEQGIRRALPWIIAIVTAVTFAGLTIALRAPVVALKAVVLNLLVAAAAVGATVAVFQDGHLAGMLGHQAAGSLFATVPVVAFGAAFGIGMDYELFLLGAMRAAREEGLQETESVVAAVARTAGLITRAAAIMISVFAGFATSALPPLAMIGFALAVGVLLDATLVRLALAPALLQLAGRWNWWWPRA